jgi:hypothetical protein
MITDKEKLEVLKWLFHPAETDMNYRGTGRSTLLAKAFISSAKSAANTKVIFFDHETKERHVKYGKDNVRRIMANIISEMEPEESKHYQLAKDYIIYHS